jgi:putative transposase
VRVPIEPGATYVFDKAYVDYNWWHDIHTQGAYFVTRFKRNAALRVKTDREVPPEAASIVLKDQIVQFAHRRQGGGRHNRYEGELRRVEVAREGDTPLVFATNDLESTASEIAQLYKDRWQVELFFKWIKQHLNIKRLCGRSENAVRIQVLTALISYLLLTLYKQAHGVKKSLWDLLAELRSTLFQRPSVEAAQYQRRRLQQHEFNARQPGLFS